MHDSRVIARMLPAPMQQRLSNREHGTKVTVNNLFGNMPVRVKYRQSMLQDETAEERLWEGLRSALTGLLLAWPRRCSLTVKDHSGKKRLNIRDQANFSANLSTRTTSSIHESAALLVPHVCSVLSQANYIIPSDFNSWKLVAARTGAFSIRGAVSLLPAPTKDGQFVSLGPRPLDRHGGGSVIFQQINKTFAASSFGIAEDYKCMDDATDGKKSKDKVHKNRTSTYSRLRGLGKGVDRWPMFFIRVDHRPSATDCLSDEADVLSTEGTLQSLIDVLTAMLIEFLKAHYFRPHGTKRKFGAEDRDREASPIVSSHSAAQRTRFDPGGQRGHSPFMNSVTSGKSRNSSRKPRLEGQRSSRLFDEWSRIKSGKQGGLADICAGLPRSKVAESTACSVTNLSQRTSIPQRSLSTSTHYPRNMDVKNTSRRGPLLAQSTISPAHDNSSVDLGSRDQNLDMANDDAKLWRDPISKNILRINARTGAVMKAEFRPASAPAQLLSGSTTNPLREPTRPVTKRCSTAPTMTPKEGSWTESLLKNWENPIFGLTADPIPIRTNELAEAGGSNHHGCCHEQSGAAFDGSRPMARINVQGLRTAEVIGQVDRKFILVRVAAASASRSFNGPGSGNSKIVVLVDQHAADERCRVEQLYSALCGPATPAVKQVHSGLGFASELASLPLEKALSFQISAREHDLFRSQASFFASWGILYSLPKTKTAYRIAVTSLPPTIAERCRLEPKLLIDLLRTEIWTESRPRRLPKDSIEDSQSPTTAATAATGKHWWFDRIAHCPRGILDLVNSRACRSAIMFNDVLDIQQCKELVSRLAECALPFQCAHGRPSMAPLLDLGLDGIDGGSDGDGDGLGLSLGLGMASDQSPSVGASFLSEWKRWKRDRATQTSTA